VSLILREVGAAGPELVACIQAHYQRCINGFAPYIQVAIERQIYRPVDPHLAGWAIFGMRERAVYYALFVDEQAELDQLVNELVRLELGGLLADG
jgi:hypothetical protein